MKKFRQNIFIIGECIGIPCLQCGSTKRCDTPEPSLIIGLLGIEFLKSPSSSTSNRPLLRITMGIPLLPRIPFQFLHVLGRAPSEQEREVVRTSSKVQELASPATSPPVAQPITSG